MPELLPLPASGEGSFDEGGMRVVWAEVPLAAAEAAARSVHAALMPELLPLPASGEGSFDEGGMRVVWAEVPLAAADAAARSVHAGLMSPR
jgi:hypothetical protein